MPSTLNRNYTYPSPADANNVPYAMQVLAEEVDADTEQVARAHSRKGVRGTTSTIGAGTWTQVVTASLNGLPAGLYDVDAFYVAGATAAAGVINHKVTIGAQAATTVTGTAAAVNAMPSVSIPYALLSDYVHDGSDVTLALWIQPAVSIALGAATLRVARRGEV